MIKLRTLIAAATIAGFAFPVFANSNTMDTANNQTAVMVTTQSKLININTANAKTLATLPGIGKKKAAIIVAYRKKNGNFTNIQELTKNKELNAKLKLGTKRFAKLKGHITTKTTS